MKYLLIFLFLISNSLLANISIPDDGDVLVFENRARKSYLESEKEYNVLVWNIFKGARDNFSRVFSDTAPKHDFILLQEADRNDRFNFLLLELFFYEFSMSQSFINDGIGTGVAMVSRFKSDQIHWLRSEGREPVIKTPKMIQINTYEIMGRDDRLMMVNIHGINFVRNGAFNKQILQLAKAIDHHKGPILVGGDFNTWSNKRLNFLKKTISKQNLKKVIFDNSKVLKKFLGNVLDHVFVRGLNVIKARADKLKNASDHAAMLLKVKLNQ
jgi:endonuclease/exonuclease/phosphatase (EEP) superfamily protein YafD